MRLSVSDRLKAPARRDVLSGAAAALSCSLASPAIARTPRGIARLDASVVVTKQRLDQLVAIEHAKFNERQVLKPFDAARQGAKADVALHRLTTFTTVPETGERVKVSGLLAVPNGARGPLPVVSWQHGTILSFDQVPSNLTKIAQPGYAMRENVDSAETLFNVHRFAAVGYAVIAADYLGKGPYRDGRDEAYAVRGATVQTCLDVLDAGRAALRELGLSMDSLFLNGWSQGALNTQWLRQALQRRGVAVAATAAESPFNDLSESFRFWASAQSFPNPTPAPYPAEPDWVSLCMIVVLGSYQRYYGIDGLMTSAVKAKYHALAQKFWSDYSIAPGEPFPAPTDLLVEGFFDRFTAPANSAFLRRLASNRATYWAYDSPVRFFYGLADEAIHPASAQRPLGAGGAQVAGVSVARASHRATFLASLYGEGDELGGQPNAPAWFASLRAA